MAWRHLGLVRDREGLEAALAGLDALAEVADDRGVAGPASELAAAEEALNLWTVGRLVARAALVREESRGSHYRRDFPDSSLAWRRRLFWTYGDLLAARPRPGSSALRPAASPPSPPRRAVSGPAARA
ncbi:MAG: hypothetical protein MI919_12600, partial [Holophagales bacterium]|nr:hypothetical protein [Holophagales bacterium]